MPIDVLTADLGRRVRAGFTARSGGVSEGAYDSLNLARHVGDRPAAVSANRHRLADWLGAPVSFVNQVHGRDVLVLDGRPADTAATAATAADALVATGPAGPVGVLVADCVPVLLADPEAGVVGAAHAGRKGLLAGVVQAAVEAMTARGARPERIRAVAGPAAGGCCYEVPAAMRDEVAARYPDTFGHTRKGTPSLDLRAGVLAALAEAGVGSADLVGGCTIEDETLFSYRRAGGTGRFAGVVRLLP